MNYHSGFGSGYGSATDGGGFMSPGIGSPSGSQKKKNRSQTLLPVTAAMIHKADYNVTEDVFSFDGVEIHQVTFVGIIREVQEAATNITYKIDDMTGNTITVKKWIDADDHLDQHRRSECREDTYIRVVGNMKAFNEGKVRSVMAFSMTPIKEFDEITFHFLDVIHANLSLKKGSNENGNSIQMYGQQNNDVYSGGVNDAGLTGQNKVVYNYIASSSAEQGISIQELKNKNRNMNEQQLRNCLEWLSNEGHIYSTIDDDHYRSTSS